MKNSWWAVIVSVVILLLLTQLSCLDDSENQDEGKSCSSHSECGEQTGDWCFNNAGGRHTCRRTSYCFGKVCRTDCTDSCYVGYGAGYMGASDTIDCSGNQDMCPSGTDCGRIMGSYADGYFVCAPE